ncbi:MAG: hypothetical protein FJY75_00800 [Candidatus Eisenbacteria bacterium]|uniref:M20/M25/M40 family metallo-hydrolase n=1 Tax=Eiseniibacteriota bacterium TaxID=2212470 RepID=A0A938BPS9_UNCEI|nr:hypothetical protein [Candidatus Eisenbacteria bacterium]
MSPETVALRRLRSLCAAILARPTASFHEHAVARFLAGHAAALGLPAAADRWGNLHVRAGGEPRPRRRGADAPPRGPRGGAGGEGDAPPWVLVAHMDHPGFVVEASRGRRALARWFGRVEPRYFAGARVRIDLGQGRSVAGRVTRIRRRSPAGRVQQVGLLLQEPVPEGAIGQWDLPACRIAGSRLSTRAADDLIGCAILAAILESVAARGGPALRVVYTRAEEAGLTGATALARAGILPREAPVLSLETSRETPGARLGDGVILRLGDRVSAFDASLLRLLKEAAERVAGRRRGFRHARALMDGGTCEASPFAAWGYRSGGLAVPLRHYHNMGPRGIAAEIVDLADLRSALALLHEVVAAPPPRRWPAPAPTAPFSAWLAPHEARLRRTALSPPRVSPPRRAPGAGR